MIIEDIAALTAESRELKDWKWDFLLAPLGYDSSTRKYILSLKTRSDSLRFFIKVSTIPKFSDQVEREGKTIDHLRRLGVPGIPDPVLTGTVNGRKFLVQKFIDAKTLQKSEMALEAARDRIENWLLNLYGKTRDRGADADELMKRSDQNISDMSGYIHAEDALAIMDAERPEVPIPTSWIHGEFWQNNVLVGKKQVWIVDFATCSANEPPLDILDLVSHHSPRELLSSQKLTPFISKFIPLQVNPVFLVMYSLIRRMSLLIREQIKVKQELSFMKDIESALAKIPVVQVFHNTVRNYNSKLINRT